MSHYVEILSVQRPFEIGVDDNQRSEWSVNFEALAYAPAEKWEEEIAARLASVGLATLGIDTFIGQKATIPTGDGPYATILNTGGGAPMDTHNGDGYERLAAQIIVRAKSYTAGRTRIHAIWRALDGIANATITA